MGREKINLFDVLDKYEYWKRKCVKSVLGVFSSGVSVCRNKGAQSDLGTPFHQGLGGTGGPSFGFVHAQYGHQMCANAEVPGTALSIT